MNWSSLKQKKWGLPLYIWAIIVVILVIGLYYLYKKRSSNANTTTSNTAPIDTTPVDTSGDPLADNGGGGGLGIPISPNIGADTTTGSVIPQATNTNLDVPTETTPQATTQPAPNVVETTSPVAPKATATQVAPVPKSVLVPSNATATSLQKTVAPTGPSHVFVPATRTKVLETQHPAAVKVKANKTGASANKEQGIFSIH